MRNTHLYFLILLMNVFLGGFVSATNYYVSPTGSDVTGNGSLQNPYGSLMKAHSYLVAGDTLFMRGGTYQMNESQIALKSSIFAYMNYLDKNGSSSSKRICYFAYPGEKPVINMSNVKPVGYRNIVFYVKGSYLHIKGLEIVGTQVTILTHTQSECFRNEGGSNNIFEQCVMHDGMAIGFYLTKGSNNLVLNCDAYRNWDNVSENMKGGNVDGFGGHPNKGSTGNIFRGCRAWFNSDDGYDCINAYESISFENCWGFFNGYSSSFASLGDGNGFKAGGYGQAPVVSSLPSPIPSHKVTFCLAFRNKANGIYANHHVDKGNIFYNNTAYRNGTNYNMLSQKITKSSITGKDTTLDCEGFNHVLRNNLSFRYSTQTELKNMGTSSDAFNSFTVGSGITVNSLDFKGLNDSQLLLPRKEDGSLPDIDFLFPVYGSDLIDRGTNVGFPFQGTQPDLGTFETGYNTTDIQDANLEEVLKVYSQPLSDRLMFSKIITKAELYDLSGKKWTETENSDGIQLNHIPAGLYILRYSIHEKKGTQLIPVLK